jgi:hypothetical protein
MGKSPCLKSFSAARVWTRRASAGKSISRRNSLGPRAVPGVLSCLRVLTPLGAGRSTPPALRYCGPAALLRPTTRTGQRIITLTTFVHTGPVEKTWWLKWAATASTHECTRKFGMHQWLGR